MTSRLTDVTSLLVGIAIALCASVGTAAPPEARAIPPIHCRSAACLDGARLYQQAKYEEAAKRLEAGLWQEDESSVDLAEHETMLLIAAAAHERAGHFARAGSFYDRLSRLDDDTPSFFAYRALDALLAADTGETPLLRELVDRGALQRPYPGSGQVALESHVALEQELPPAETAEEALVSGDRSETCPWLAEQLQNPPAGDETSSERRKSLANVVYGHCIEPDLTAETRQSVIPDSPTVEAIVTHGEMLYARVRYEKAVKSLASVDWKSVKTPLACRGRFRPARSHYRLKHYDSAAKLYAEIAEDCDTEATVDQRIRALYALGRRHHLRDDFDTSDEYFESILEDYPARSHADDALMYLGRNARARDQDEREAKLLDRALEDYPGGDMVREFAWESLESLYRGGAYAEYIDELDALELSGFDNHYYSQGRLDYFRGWAEWKTGEKDAAVASWSDTWERYPFSFYGYLSHLALRDAGRPVPALDGTLAEAPAGWFHRDNWEGRRVRSLLDVGLFEMAAEYETGRLFAARASADRPLSDAAWWRLAYLWDRAGDTHQSHNIPRRNVSGRPWSKPVAGRKLRWQIAFPRPFGGEVEDAIQAEAQDRPDARVSRHLPLALMREESGFDEDVVSWAGAVGLMQLMPATARHHDSDVGGDVDVEALKRSEINIRVGIDHLFLLADKFDSHPAVMIAAYNAGMGAVGGWLRGSRPDAIALWVEDIPYRQTRNYTKRVMGSYAAYQWLSGRTRLDPTVGDAPPSP